MACPLSHMRRFRTMNEERDIDRKLPDALNRMFSRLGHDRSRLITTPSQGRGSEYCCRQQIPRPISRAVRACADLIITRGP